MSDPTCPYCGHNLLSNDANQCDSCGGVFVSHSGPATVRRRRIRKPSTTLILTLSLIFLSQVALLLFIVNRKGGFGTLRYGENQNEPSPPSEDPVQKPEAIERTAAQLATMSVPTLGAYEHLLGQQIAEPFTTRFEQITALIERAKAAEQGQKYTEAYSAYHEARLLIQPLETELAQWNADQELRDELAKVSDEVGALRVRAETALAPRWSPKAWTQGESAWALSKSLATQAKYEQAIQALADAGLAYRSACDEAESAKLATDALNQLTERMKSGYSEELLRKHAAEALDRMKQKRQEAAAALNELRFKDAEHAYLDATTALDEAEQAAEHARYRKLYAYQAGQEASALLLAIASGDGVDAQKRDALINLYDRLGLTKNPATPLPVGDKADFASSAQELVNTARDAIAQRHDRAVQACYHAGFQVSIISQMLKTESLSAEQQKNIHQSLGVMQEQARAAGWDMPAIVRAIESVREKNRNARLNTPPIDTAAAWQRYLETFTDQNTALRLLDPELWPASPEDPELFKGLGATTSFR